MQSMIFELRARGIDLNDPSLTLVELYEGLDYFYGDEIAQMIIEEVVLKREKLAEEQMYGK